MAHSGAHFPNTGTTNLNLDVFNAVNACVSVNVKSFHLIHGSLYFVRRGTISPLHTEDVDLFSVNFLHSGGGLKCGLLLKVNQNMEAKQLLNAASEQH